MKNIIFDIDGVLFEVTESFHSAIKSTVYFYLKEILRQDVSENIVTEDDIRLFKAQGGFNDDWDLTCAFITYFVSLMPQIDLDLSGIPFKDIIAFTTQHITVKSNIEQNKNIKQFLGLEPGTWNLDAVFKLTSAINQNLVLFGADLLKDNLVKRIFQEFYWGKEEFYRIYGEDNLFYNGSAYINKEKILIDKNLLEELYNKDDIMLSIATGRERIDAEYSLNRADIRKYFNIIFTLSDIPESSKKKPHPYSLYCIEEKAKDKNIEERFFIGDQIDDVLMANSAKERFVITSVGYVYDKDAFKIENMKKNKADFIITNHKKILQIIA